MWYTVRVWVTLVFFCAVMGLAVYVGIDQYMQRPPTVSENEKAAMVAGIVIGLDIALAVRGEAAMDKDRWMQLAQGFEKHVEGCTDMACVMTRVMELREAIRQKMTTLSGPEVFR